MTSWPLQRWLAVVLTASGYALVVGVPTVVVPTSLFSRMTPVQWWNYPVLVVSAILAGLVAATYVRSPAAPGGVAVPAGGGLLSALAIGCPVCNKIVVAVLGMSGAMNVWAPLQPALGLVSIGLLGWALRTRLAGEFACRIPTAA